MPTAIADTSPISYLVIIGVIGILPRLFDEVRIPDVVYSELLHPKAPASVRHWAEIPPEWLTVVSTAATGDADLGHLDAGERAVIGLAISDRPEFVLIDDRVGVAAARARGLEVTGTLGLLDRAARAGLIELDAAVAALKLTNFRARPSLFDTLLARERAR